MNPKDPLLHPDLLQDCLSLTKDTIDTFQKIKQKRSAMISPIQTLGQGLHKHSTMPKQDNAPQITDEMLDDFRKSKYFSFMDGPYKMIKAWEEFKSSYSVSSSGRDWEIQCLVVGDKNYWKQKGQDGYTSGLFEEMCWVEDLMAHPDFKFIRSVKRLSDGEVFCIGDSVRYCPVSRYGSFVIEKIWINTIDKERCMVSDKDQCLVETIDASLEKIKASIQEEKPLQRPILGLQPEYFWKQERLNEIRQAMSRYIEEKKDIPVVWVTEEFALREWTENNKHRI